MIVYVVACGTKPLGGLHESLESARVAASAAFADGCSPESIHPVGGSAQTYLWAIEMDERPADEEAFSSGERSRDVNNDGERA